ncbi:hypothetical protein ES703_68448 [subsurface metagenome]
MDSKVKAIRIQSQLHIICHRGVSGYKTLCGKTASFGHQVHQLEPGEITCPECVGRQRSEAER